MTEQIRWFSPLFFSSISRVDACFSFYREINGHRCLKKFLPARGGASHHGHLRVSDETNDGKETDFHDLDSKA